MKKRLFSLLVTMVLGSSCAPFPPVENAENKTTPAQKQPTTEVSKEKAKADTNSSKSKELSPQPGAGNAEDKISTHEKQSCLKRWLTEGIKLGIQCEAKKCKANQYCRSSSDKIFRQKKCPQGYQCMHGDEKECEVCLKTVHECVNFTTTQFFCKKMDERSTNKQCDITPGYIDKSSHRLICYPV